MGIEKWYPTATELSSLLASVGWSIQSVAQGPPLPLTAEDLMRRYKLSQADLARIRADLFQRYGEIPGVIQFQPQGFCAYLHYKIYVCRAV